MFVGSSTNHDEAGWTSFVQKEGLVQSGGGRWRADRSDGAVETFASFGPTAAIVVTFFPRQPTQATQSLLTWLLQHGSSVSFGADRLTVNLPVDTSGVNEVRHGLTFTLDGYMVQSQARIRSR